MARLRDSPDDLFALVGRTSEALRLPPEFIEKDFWITEVLRSVARPTEGAFVVFKGGTSLSKGYGLIERFSEDVDILVVPARRPGAGGGKGGVDGILKGLASRVHRDLGLSEGDMALEGSARGIHRNVRYGYPARREAAAVRPGVLLEMGVRGRPDPCESRTIRSLLGGYALESLGEPEDGFEEFRPVEIRVLHPVRTLFEKLAALHNLASTLPASAAGLRRSARHLYDVFRLLSDGRVRAALGASPGVAEEAAADIESLSREWGWPQTPRPEGGYAVSPAFDPHHPSHAVLAAGYEDLRPLIVGTMPLLEECLRAVRGAAGTL